MWNSHGKIVFAIIFSTQMNICITDFWSYMSQKYFSRQSNPWSILTSKATHSDSKLADSKTIGKEERKKEQGTFRQAGKLDSLGYYMMVEKWSVNCALRHDHIPGRSIICMCSVWLLNTSHSLLSIFGC